MKESAIHWDLTEDDITFLLQRGEVVALNYETREECAGHTRKQVEAILERNLGTLAGRVRELLGIIDDLYPLAVVFAAEYRSMLGLSDNHPIHAGILQRALEALSRIADEVRRPVNQDNPCADCINGIGPRPDAICNDCTNDEDGIPSNWAKRTDDEADSTWLKLNKYQAANLLWLLRVSLRGCALHFREAPSAAIYLNTGDWLGEVERRLRLVVDEHDPTNAALPSWWDKDSTADESPKGRIVASAIRLNGVVYTGHRHHNIIRYLAELGFSTPIGGEQGFIDDHGNFLSRNEAGDLALASGQIDKLMCPGMGLDSSDIFPRKPAPLPCGQEQGNCSAPIPSACEGCGNNPEVGK